MLVNKAVAHPWFCDVLGHMTTRHYVAMFDDASYHLLAAVFDWPGVVSAGGEIGFVDVKHVIEYQAEVSAGDILDIHAGVTKVGNKSLTVNYRMNNLSKQELAATFECIYVLFDMHERAGLSLTDELREKALAHTTHCAPQI